MLVMESGGIAIRSSGRQKYGQVTSASLILPEPGSHMERVTTTSNAARSPRCAAAWHMAEAAAKLANSSFSSFSATSMSSSDGRDNNGQGLPEPESAIVSIGVLIRCTMAR